VDGGGSNVPEPRFRRDGERATPGVSQQDIQRRHRRCTTGAKQGNPPGRQRKRPTIGPRMRAQNPGGRKGGGVGGGGRFLARPAGHITRAAKLQTSMSDECRENAKLAGFGDSYSNKENGQAWMGLTGRAALGPSTELLRLRGTASTKRTSRRTASPVGARVGRCSRPRRFAAGNPAAGRSAGAGGQDVTGGRVEQPDATNL